VKKYDHHLEKTECDLLMNGLEEITRPGISVLNEEEPDVKPKVDEAALKNVLGKLKTAALQGRNR
jgi:hypothetical protein